MSATASDGERSEPNTATATAPAKQGACAQGAGRESARCRRLDRRQAGQVGGCAQSDDDRRLAARVGIDLGLDGEHDADADCGEGGIQHEVRAAVDERTPTRVRSAGQSPVEDLSSKRAKYSHQRLAASTKPAAAVNSEPNGPVRVNRADRDRDDRLAQHDQREQPKPLRHGDR
jgi:hypothetical protein